MSVAISSRPKAVTMNVRERTRGWLSPVNLHWAGVVALALLCLYLLIRMVFAWQLAQSQNADALARQQVDLTAARIAAKPLQGLDAKIATTSASADRFYRDRLPVSYSEVASELGELRKKTNVRLTRVQYAQKAVSGEAAGQLTEVDMDANLSGDYRPLMLFINGLERDRMFFLISGLTLTGQTTGQVNLRLHLTTYLRGTPSEEERQKAEVATTDASGSDIDTDLDKAAARRNGGAR